MQIVSDRPLTINSETFHAGHPFETEDWRAQQLIQAGTARHAKAPNVLYETNSRKQNDAVSRDEGHARGIECDDRRDGYVSCICLTRNRRDWLPKAIACYQGQTYPTRELLIIADGEDVRDLIPDDETIRLLHIEEGYGIGEKRNFGASQASGAIIAHFDDDDYSAPGRLVHQVSLLRESGKAVTGYRSMVFRSSSETWRYTHGSANYAVGTSLCYRKDWWQTHPFLSIQIGEDGEFVRVAQQHDQIISADAGELMWATVHPGNTSPRNLETSNFERIPNFDPLDGDGTVESGWSYRPQAK